MTRGKGGKFYDDDDLDYDEGDDWEDWEEEDLPPPVKPQHQHQVGQGSMKDSRGMQQQLGLALSHARRVDGITCACCCLLMQCMGFPLP